MSNIRCATCHDFLQMNSAGEVCACANCARPLEAPANHSPTRRSSRRAPRTNFAIVCLLAVLTTVGFYAGGPLTLLRDTRFYGMFCGHGSIPYIALFLFCVALWMLILKFPAIHREYQAFDFDLLPTDSQGQIDRNLSGKILDRIARLSPRQQKLLLVSRIRQALLRLNQLGKSEHLDEILKHRSDSDAGAVESSYALPRFIIWAIPVLGFVGTVLGISNGVSAFSTLIQNASDLEGLRESLKGVTYGLGQAFETTMLALCMSLILMLIMSVLQKKDDELLEAIDEYCVEHLLHRVVDRPNSAPEHADLVQVLGRLSEFLESHPVPTPIAPVPHTNTSNGEARTLVITAE